MLGWVQRYHSNYFYVQAGGFLWECSLKGLLKKQNQTVLVGDTVELDSLEEANRVARISKVLERTNELQRPKIANVDQVLLVAPWQQPALDPRQIDRMLCHIALAGLPVTLVITKTDLPVELCLPAESPEEMLETYKQLGYSVIKTSIYKPESLKPLKELLKNKRTVLAGVSGAGKSSLINALNPQLQLKTGEVSQKLERGQHTTRQVSLLEVLPSAWVADTPGFSHLSLTGILPEQVEKVFKEFEWLKSQCAYDNCLHKNEENCAVKAQLGSTISQSRYQHYLELLEEAETAKQSLNSRSQKIESALKSSGGPKNSLQTVRLKENLREANRRVNRQKISQAVTHSRYGEALEESDEPNN